jgi:hypothetical protein
MALTRFGLRLTASGSQDADLGSTRAVLNLQKNSSASSTLSKATPWQLPTASQPSCRAAPSEVHGARRITDELLVIRQRTTSLPSFATRFCSTVMGRVRPDAAQKPAITKELQASLRNSIRSVPEGASPPWNANLTCSLMLRSTVRTR